MSEQAESYMAGWRAGYHNATLAERERILKILKANTDQELLDKLTEAIKAKEG